MDLLSCRSVTYANRCKTLAISAITLLLLGYRKAYPCAARATQNYRREARGWLLSASSHGSNGLVSTYGRGPHGRRERGNRPRSCCVFRMGDDAGSGKVSRRISAYRALAHRAREP